MVRHEGDNGGSFNRSMYNANPANKDEPNNRPIDEQKYGCHCVAGKCAMWRWGTFIAPPAGAEPGKLVAGVTHRSELVGYCGLAGNPGMLE